MGLARFYANLLDIDKILASLVFLEEIAQLLRDVEPLSSVLRRDVKQRERPVRLNTHKHVTCKGTEKILIRRWYVYVLNDLVDCRVVRSEQNSRVAVENM